MTHKHSWSVGRASCNCVIDVCACGKVLPGKTHDAYHCSTDMRGRVEPDEPVAVVQEPGVKEEVKTDGEGPKGKPTSRAPRSTATESTSSE